MTLSFSLILYLLCVLVFLLVLAFLIFTGYLHYVHWKYSHIPQPNRPSFYFGHLPDLNKDGKQEVWFVPIFLQWLEQVRSPTFVVFFFKDPVILTTDPESVKVVIMQSKLNKDSNSVNIFAHIFGERLMGNGIVTIPDNETWKPRRQLYDPAFKKSYLKTLLEPINDEANKFIELLKPLADGVTRVPINIHFGDFTVDIISKVGFGIERHYQQTDGFNLRNFVPMMLKGTELQIRIPGYKYLHPFEAAKYKNAIRNARAFARKCIRERIQAIESGKDTPKDILTHILRMSSIKENVDIEDLVDDFISFFIGGQDSTQSLLTFAVVLTLLHPDVLARVQQEVDEVLGSKTSVSEEDLEKLEYIEQVLKETLRLHAPFPDMFLRAVPPEGITLNGYHIPCGAKVMLTSSFMCCMPEHFDDPETFNPGRFDPENERPNSFVYFPFGVGPRSCIGKNFAMMNAKVVLSRLFQTVKISLPENYELVVIQRATIQPKDDVHCTLQCCK